MRRSVTCPLDCPDACRLVVTVEGGRLVRVEGDPDHPFTRGLVCGKMRRYAEREHHPERLLHPLRRVGDKGGGGWERVSWERALDDIASRLADTLERWGGEAVLPYSYAGTMGFAQRVHAGTLFRSLGACELEGTICSSAASAGWAASYGTPMLGPEPEDVVHARLIILWGSHTLATNLHLVPFLKEARSSGARILHVDPCRSRTSRFADEHLSLAPGTDAALAYALAHVILRDGLQDATYLAEATTGLDDYAAEAARWTPARASELTGIPAARIERLAVDYATTCPAFIRIGNGMTRQPGGAASLRAVALLPALIGAWRERGGGALSSTSGAFALDRSAVGGAHLPPGPRRVNMSTIASALTELDPPLRCLFVYNSNPAAIAPSSGRIRAGLRRDDLFTVVLEQVQTDTSRLADYVLPVTTFLEHPDLYVSYGHHYLGWNEAALEPPGEAWPNTRVFTELGRRLGVDEPSLGWDAVQVGRALLGAELEPLRAAGWRRLELPSPLLPYASGAPTPSGRVELSPPPAVLPTTTTPDHPLILLTPPVPELLNSTFGCMPSATRRAGGEQVLRIHPEDAAARGLDDGDWAEVRSAAGCVTRTVRITDAVRPGCVALPGVWGGAEAADGRPTNEVTAELLTDLGAGAALHATPVEVGVAG